MKSKNKASEIFYKIIKKKKSVNCLIKEIRKGNLTTSEKYAYQAFCCAILSKESESYLQKIKYIKQYGQFISKSFQTDSKCIEARLVRFLIEQKLENVKFINHTKEDIKFLKNCVNQIQNSKIKELVLLIIK